MLLTISTAVIATLSSCDISKWGPDDCPPDEPVPDVPEPSMAPVTLNLNFDTELPLHKEITYSRYNEDDHDLRYIVQIFHGARSKSDVPALTLTYTRPFDENPDFSTTLTLDDGEYEFFAWTDYVDPGTDTDKYYSTADWNYISLFPEEDHPGSNERRDCFRGNLKKTVINDPVPGAGNTIDIEMLRPVARFELMATDVEEFITNEAARLMSRATDVNFSDYTVVIQYDNYMPSAYNLYTDTPNDARTKVYFVSTVEELENEASMGFDYVFVRHDESELDIVMGLYDKKGNLISSTNPISVPLLRSKNTIVRGEFLSAKGSGGVGIVPDYDGEYNVEYHF